MIINDSVSQKKKNLRLNFTIIHAKWNSKDSVPNGDEFGRDLSSARFKIYSVNRLKKR